jgi:GTPase SAR1 family protein
VHAWMGCRPTKAARQVTVLVLGVDNAGKSTLIQVLKRGMLLYPALSPKKGSQAPFSKCACSLTERLLR